MWVNICIINGNYRLSGCKAYFEACPFRMMQFNEGKGVTEKCRLCYHRTDRGENPVCVDKCIGRCVYFGEIRKLLIHIEDKGCRLGFNYDEKISIND